MSFFLLGWQMNRCHRCLELAMNVMMTYKDSPLILCHYLWIGLILGKRNVFGVTEISNLVKHVNNNKIILSTYIYNQVLHVSDWYFFKMSVINSFKELYIRKWKNMFTYVKYAYIWINLCLYNNLEKKNLSLKEKNALFIFVM